ncbi:hypothetical protein [Schaalia sp. lx-260]|uniref:hypothetical protein n=1 Tax=Schaalia sp. lx-260 TaxID=2899082 RepID=UPI001E385637|nr:hypothetical protein [Schaalia sp. lx-260]MCD4549678.1 hypothetical protein [Schaalia sp. lx-260]
MGRTQTKLDINFDELARALEPVIEQKTRDLATRAGEGFVGDVVWTDRPHGLVRTATEHARERNARENTLLKAVHG